MSEQQQQIDEVLDFWFGETLKDPARIAARMGFWFGSDDHRDTEIRERWGRLVTAASEGKLDTWTRSARGRLPAEVCQRPKTPLRVNPFARAINQDPRWVHRQLRRWESRGLDRFVDPRRFLASVGSVDRLVPADYDWITRPLSLARWLGHHALAEQPHGPHPRPR